MWGHLHGERPESVFLSTWHVLPELPAQAIDWAALIALRGDVARELERLRIAGVIGAPLDAQLQVWCTPEQHGRLSVLGSELRFFMITSDAQVHPITHGDKAALPAEAVLAASVEGGGVWIAVQPSSHTKCKRCWHHRADVGVSAQHPDICARCVDNLSLPGESRRYS
jgi:isoleucyl-tRNA synthetase